MRQAIQTTHRGPSARYGGGSVTARCDAGRVTVHWDGSVGQAANHEAAARALAAKLGWAWEHVGGGIGNGYVWVSP